MNFAATFDVKINFNDPALFAGFAADFEKLYSKYVSGAVPPAARQMQPAPATLPPIEAPAAPLSSPVSFPEDDDADGDVSGDTECVTAPDKPKRRRRTKAEMEAARAAEGAPAAPAPDLPKPHGGGNTGTTAPLELPSSDGEIQMPQGDITEDAMKGLFARIMMLEPDPSAEISSEILAPHGLSRLKDAQPEQRKSICEGFVRIARSRGK